MLGVRYTHEFVRTALPDGARKVLEIGCGAGRLARMLADDGYDVTAIDSDPGAVAEAQRNGVATIAAEWPAAVDGRFDAVLFTRSLHHIHELDEALGAAANVLRPGGRIIVEDFRSEGVGDRSIAWFESAVRAFHSQGFLKGGAHLAAILASARPAGDEHELHSSGAIARALRGLGAVEQADAAYYFRYVEPETVSGEHARRFLDAELAAIASGGIDPLGKRFVLTRSP